MTEKKTTPTNYQLEKVDQKPLPPPVALKPKRKSGVVCLVQLIDQSVLAVEEEEEEGGGGGGGGGKEETDGSPSISRSDLDSMVLGVKVREAAERPEMVTITEGLKMAAASGGRSDLSLSLSVCLVSCFLVSQVSLCEEEEAAVNGGTVRLHPPNSAHQSSEVSGNGGY